MEMITVLVYDVQTGQTIEKELEVVRTNPPSIQEDEILVEVWETTDTQYIQRWYVEKKPKPTEAEKQSAQVLYTAIMTDTLIEDEEAE